MKKRIVADVTNPNVVRARPDMTVQDAEEMFARRGVTGAPVIDDTGRLVGVITLNDLVRYMAETVTVSESGKFMTDVEEYKDIAQVTDTRTDTPIDKIMTRKVYSVPHDATVAMAANVMRERRVHRLMVMRGSTLVGVVTTFDLLRIVEEAC